MGGVSKRYLEALRDYMVQEATTQRDVYKNHVDEIYFSRENWTRVYKSEIFGLVYYA